MPNWVYNSVSVSGTEEDVRKFSEKAGRPFTTYFKGVRSQKEDGTWSYDADAIEENVSTKPISFMNFATPENLDAYFGASDYKPDGYEDLSFEERFAIALKHSSDGWYDWNVRNWGTKWDACDADKTEEVYENGTGRLGYSFNTAWSPAEGAYRQMVEQHPELAFTFWCEEEQGFGVEFAGEDGELFTIKEWDIPDSHADYKERDNEEGCRCGWDDDPEEWFEDCPDRAEKIQALLVETQQAVEKFEDISELTV